MQSVSSGSDIKEPALRAGAYGPPGGYGGAPPGGFGPPPGGGPPGYGGPPPGGGPPGYGGPPGGGGFGGPPGGGFGGPPGGGFGGPPGGGFGGQPGGDAALALSKVKAPAIAMLVFAIIGAVFDLIQLVMHVLGTGVAVANGSEAEQIMNGAVGTVVEVVGLLSTGFCVWGLLKMMKLQSRTVSYIAVIMSMAPCTGSCCFINMFIGIWALMVLADPVVKAHHR